MSQDGGSLDDLGMSFGEVEETQPDTELRPDQNKHYAVVPVWDPSAADLPIYVDVDAMRDMENHALSDTSVELGGVMLGAQCVDEDGNAFVVITDSLRAEHYESTKGSFKFTHETWTKISRQREEFPDDLQMVGWYHTHPDWGVFLSGMDMFICDNFFNRPLDVALVIDPCRQDRGMFMWTPGQSGRVRRTDGFYLIGSRFRSAELMATASQLEGKIPMSVDPRYSQSSPQVIQVGGPSGGPPWMLAAVLGVLAVQMMLVALLAWKVIAPTGGEGDSKQLAGLQERVEELAETRQAAAEAEAQMRVLDQVVSQFAQGGRPDPISLLSKKELELEEAQQLVRTFRSRERDLKNEADTAKLDLQEAETRVEKLEEAVDALRDQKQDLVAKLSDERKAIAALKKEYGIAADEDGDGESSKWKWYAVAGAGALLFLFAGIGMAVSARRERDRELEMEEEIDPRTPDPRTQDLPPLKKPEPMGGEPPTGSPQDGPPPADPPPEIR